MQYAHLRYGSHEPFAFALPIVLLFARDIFASLGRECMMGVTDTVQACMHYQQVMERRVCQMFKILVWFGNAAWQAFHVPMRIQIRCANSARLACQPLTIHLSRTSNYSTYTATALALYNQEESVEADCRSCAAFSSALPSAVVSWHG